MNQTYCVACFEWRKSSSKIMDSNVENQSKKTETATSVPDNDDALSSIKSLPSRMGNVGIKPKDIQVSRSNLEVCVRSPRESARQKCILQQKFFCSVPPIVDDESGPINAALWEEGSKIEKNFRKNNSRQDLKFDAEKGSPRAVLEGPESSGWSESSSRKSLLSFSFTGEVGTDYSGLAQPSQKHCMQSLWRSFATKKWQSFPSSYRKKELSISDPVLMSPSDRNGEEGPQSGLSDQECVDDLLSVSYNAKRSWQTFSYEDISLATNNFDPGEYPVIIPYSLLKHVISGTATQSQHDLMISLRWFIIDKDFPKLNIRSSIKDIISCVKVLDHVSFSQGGKCFYM